LAPLALLAISTLASRAAETPAPPNLKPAWIVGVSKTFYDGKCDDLLTGGLGWDGLKCNIPPKVSTQPTAAELRKLAIYVNYQALVDMSEDGGYGRLYGPNVSLTGHADKTPGAGKVAGTEYIAWSLDALGRGRPAATLVVQVPAKFNAAAPCIVTATSSGSRGVYGAVAAVGEWGLKHGCAVAYTDKGTGNGAHELFSNTVVLVDGLTADAADASKPSLFTANLTDAERATFNNGYPYRYAFKHAHSQQNPEKDWGRFTLQAIEFALYVINEQFSPAVPGTVQKQRRFSADNTLVIAASVSNGGGAALAAAEQDTEGLIDAVVVGEPQVNLRLPEGLKVARGGKPVRAFGKPLYDYVTIANLLQPVAAFAPACACSPLLDMVDITAAQKRADALVAAKLITGTTFTDQAYSALTALHDAGYEPESDLLHASHFALEATTGVAVTYANAYARARVIDNLCGFSFATIDKDGGPAKVDQSPLCTLFGLGNGIPPTNGVQIVYNDAAGGPVYHFKANGDFAFQGAQRLRELWIGSGAQADAVRAGVAEVRLTGNLRGKPAIIVHGRSDTLVPVNQTSRPYMGMNRIAEGKASRLSYIEVENAQHFDSFIGLVPGYARFLLPLHYYTDQALELMWDHLHRKTPLPPSQVVRTCPRGKVAPPVAVGINLKPISLAPARGDAIQFDEASHTVQVPE